MPFSSAARPPTPPKCNTDTSRQIDDAIKFLDTSLDTSVFLNTPPQSSPTRHPHSSQLSSREPKKIRFEPNPTVCDATPPQLLNPLEQSSALRPLPISKQQRSPRSILKIADDGKPDPSLPSGSLPSSNQYTSSKPMLDSLLNQLASDNRTSKTDAYNTLHNSLRAHSDFPSAASLSEKIPQLEQYLRRDIESAAATDNVLALKLAVQALKLLSILFSECPDVSKSFSHDWLQWLADDTIRILGASGISKELFKSQALLLTTDFFCLNALDHTRITAVVARLRDINERVSGAGVLSLRVIIYSKLVGLYRSPMLVNLPQWLPQVFHGMLSSSTDLQSRSVELGMKAAKGYGKSKLVSDTVIKFFEQPSHGQGTNFDHFRAALQEMIHSKQSNAAMVPIIWSSVILSLRGSQKTLENWPRLMPWLSVIQKCFNKRDGAVNVKAWVAWNHFIGAVKPDERTKIHVARLFLKPIVATLSRAETPDIGEATRSAALDSYSLLLFYSMRPGASSKQYTLYWDEYVVKLVSQVSQWNPGDVDKVRLVIAALLSDSTLKLWTDPHGQSNMKQPVAPSEVPRLDAQWIRDNLASILPVVESLLDISKTTNTNRLAMLDHQSLKSVWRSLMIALADAGRKEIMLSRQTRTALALLINSLQSLRTSLRHSTGQAPPLQATDESRYMEYWWSLVETAIETLGPSGFATSLAFDNQKQEFLTVDRSSPNHKDGISSKTPFGYLLDLLSTCPESQPPLSSGPDLTRSMQLIISSQPTRRSRLALLSSLLKTQSRTYHIISKSFQTYNSITAVAATALQPIGDGHHENEESLKLYDYRFVLELIFHGYASSDQAYLVTAQNLYSRVRACLKQELGDAGVILGLLQPMVLAVKASGTSTLTSTSILAVTSCLLTGSSVSPDGRSMQRVWRSLHNKDSDDDFDNEPGWFQGLLDLVRGNLKSAHDLYDCHDDANKAAAATCFKDLSRFIASPSVVSSLWTVQTLQDSLALWAGITKLTTGDSTIARQAPSMPCRPGYGYDAEFLQVWLACLNAIEAKTECDDNALEEFQSLVCGGLTSHSRRVANETLIFWNKTFGQQEALHYPAEMQMLLSRIRDVAEVRLPTFDCESPNTGPSQDTELFPWLMDDESIADGELPSPVLLKQQPQSHTEAHTPKNASNAGRRQPRPQPTPARLRHNNSQIEFVPIESSPVLQQAMESQMMTEHQREVRFRQRTEDVIFSDFRSSSPGPISWDNPFDRNRSHPALGVDGVFEEPTPQTPPHRKGSSDGDDEVVSSPLARMSSSASASKPNIGAQISVHRDVEGEEPEDIPSSPPEVRPRSYTKRPEHSLDGQVAVQEKETNKISGENASGLSSQEDRGQLGSCDENDEHLPGPEHNSFDKLVKQKNSAVPDHGILTSDPYQDAVSEQDASEDAVQDIEVQEAVQVRSSPIKPIQTSAEVQEVESLRAGTPIHKPSLERVADSFLVPEEPSPLNRMNNSRKQSKVKSLGLPTSSQKRKLTSLENPKTSKKARGAVSGSTSNVRSVSQPSTSAPRDKEADLGDTIVIKPAGPDTPSFYEVVREQIASASQLQSPDLHIPRRRGRPKGSSSQPSSLKRSLSSMDGESTNDPRPERSSAQGSRTKKAKSPGSVSPNVRRSGRGWEDAEALLTPSKLPQTVRRSKVTVSASQPVPGKTANLTTRTDPKAVSQAEGVVLGSGRASQNHQDSMVPCSVPEDDEAMEVSEPTTLKKRQRPLEDDESDETRTPLTPSSLARNVIVRFQGILKDVQKLFLGDGASEGQREELEDISHEVQREIVMAGRRKRQRTD